jgi:outer membrane receptor protein involved in Fe transport
MPAAVTFANKGTRQPKFDARLDWDGDPHRVWSVRGGLAGAYGLIHSALGPGQFESDSYASYLELDRHTDNFNFKVYWNRLDAPFDIVLYGLPEHATNDTFVADVTQRLRIHPRHTLTFGGSIRSDRFDVSIAPADTHRAEGGAFVEDAATINSWLAVTAGGRLDKFDTTGAVFAPRVGAVVTVSPRHSFRAAYNRAYRAPSLLENFLDVTLPAVVPLDPPFVYAQLSVGSTDLKMEKQDAFELGYTSLVVPHTTVFVTAYTQLITDNIWFVPVSYYGPGFPPPGWPGDPASVPFLPSIFSFRNLGHLRDSGVELAADVDVAPFTVRASYTFQGVPSFDDDLADVDLPINRPSRHQDGVTVTYRHGVLTAEGNLRYVTRAFWADVFTQPFWGYTPAYHSIDGRVSCRLPGRMWEVWARTTNLSNEPIKTHVYGDTIGRSVTAGLRWQVHP